MAAVAHLGSLADTGNTLTYTTGSFTPTAGDLLVVLAAVTATVDGTATLTESAGGGSYTQITWSPSTDNQWGGTGNRMYVFVRTALIPASPAARTFTLTLPADAGTGAQVTVVRVTGMTNTGSSAVRQLKGAKGSGTTPSLTFGSAPLTTNPIVGNLINGANPTGITIPGSFTSLGNANGFATPTTGFESIKVDSGFTSTAVTWGTSSATAWGALALELDASGAAAATSLPPLRRVVARGLIQR